MGVITRYYPPARLDEPEEEYDVYGPLCESGDLLARGRWVQRTGEGGLLAVMNVGAYGFSMASRYNSRPLPAEVMVRGKEYSLIRKRGDLP
jgi:diaminopimelate decarboxylase